MTLLLAAPHAGGTSPRRGAPAPNIVLVMTDDQALSQVGPEYMPAVTRLLAGQGTTFEDAFLTTPLCCPSRAGLLTGQYGHNNGVLTSSYGYLRDKGNVLPVWLRRAAYYDWDLSRNGRRVHYGSAPRDYAPRVFERSAARLVRRFAPRRKPIFLEVDEIAPHPRLHGKGTRCGAVPDPRDIGKFGDASLPQPPSFNEADVSDKPCSSRTSGG